MDIPEHIYIDHITTDSVLDEQGISGLSTLKNSSVIRRRRLIPAKDTYVTARRVVFKEILLFALTHVTGF